MPVNVGMLDRGIRVVFGIALLSIVFLGPQTAWGWIGLVPLVTGLAGSCPLYRMFGWSTCRVPAAAKR